MAKQSFEAWCKRVDDILWATVGCGKDDLPDIAYSVMWAAGMSPRQAAAEAKRNAE